VTLRAARAPEWLQRRGREPDCLRQWVAPLPGAGWALPPMGSTAPNRARDHAHIRVRAITAMVTYLGRVERESVARLEQHECRLLRSCGRARKPANGSMTRRSRGSIDACGEHLERRMRKHAAPSWPVGLCLLSTAAYVLGFVEEPGVPHWRAADAFSVECVPPQSDTTKPGTSSPS